MFEDDGLDVSSGSDFDDDDDPDKIEVPGMLSNNLLLMIFKIVQLTFEIC